VVANEPLTGAQNNGCDGVDGIVVVVVVVVVDVVVVIDGDDDV